MSSALEVAAIGMRTQQQALDAIANNISNINTPGFKRSELRFSELVSVPPSPANALEPVQQRLDPVSGVSVSAYPMIESQGRVEPTGNPRHIAIEGSGFIELMGPAGRSLLWRGGALRVLDDGMLATQGGFPLKAGITVPSEVSDLRIERNGTVYAITSAPNGPSETEIGTLSLVKLTDPAGAERVEGGIYSVTDAGNILEAPPGEDGLGYFVQSSLESSNVDLNNEFVQLLISQRAYAANAQVLRAADEFYSIANNMRR